MSLLRRFVFFLLPRLAFLSLFGCFGTVKPAMTADEAEMSAEHQCSRMWVRDDSVNLGTCIERRTEVLFAQDQARYQADREDQNARRAAVAESLSHLGDAYANQPAPVNCTSVAVGGIVQTRCQ
jgi:outer membrane biogenesis lipoprotein LolB